ncbi:MAG: hypothetical protein V7K67_24400 [Nostoc sp.]
MRYRTSSQRVTLGLGQTQFHSLGQWKFYSDFQQDLRNWHNAIASL